MGLFGRKLKQKHKIMLQAERAGGCPYGRDVNTEECLGFPGQGGYTPDCSYENALFYIYNDQDIDANSNFEAWNETINLLGTFGIDGIQVELSAVLPDGTVVPPAINPNYSYYPSESAYISSPIDPCAPDIGAGRIDSLSAIAWSACAYESISLSRVSIAVKNTYYRYDGSNHPVGTQQTCHYEVSCLPGTMPTCGSYESFDLQDDNHPCYPFIQVPYLYINVAGISRCSDDGPSSITSGSGACS